MKQGSYLFLGTGASQGVPIPGCDCSVCRSDDTRNRRLRSGGLFKVAGLNILLDASPDLRQQALSIDLKRVDGLILTHAHYDHVAGLDALRIYHFRQRHLIPCLLSSATRAEIEQCYHYVTRRFDFTVLPEQYGEVRFLDLPLRYMTYWQAGMAVNGYAMGDFAFVSDIRTFDDSIFTQLKGLRHLVVSALRYGDSKVHFSVQEAIEFARRTGAQHTWLVHMSHDLDHEQTNADLPPDIQLAYDGLELDFSC